MTDLIYLFAYLPFFYLLHPSFKCLNEYSDQNFILIAFVFICFLFIYLFNITASCLYLWSRAVVLKPFLHILPPFIKQDYQVYPQSTQWYSFLKNMKLNQL